MAGHSKWANIKHRKAAQDAKKGKLYTRYIREITTAARQGGPDPDSNPQLRLAIDNARKGNMTNDTINRAIKKGSGELEGDNLEEILYEGYGPGGVAVMVLCLSDNRNRTVSGVRHAFTKCGGNLGTDGSVSYLFNKQGLILFASGTDEDSVMEAALDAGADDVTTNDDGSIEVHTSVEDFIAVKEAMDAKGLVSESAELTQLAATSVELDLDNAEKMLRLNDMLDELDDVQSVYTNASIDDDLLAQLDGK